MLPSYFGTKPAYLSLPFSPPPPYDIGYIDTRLALLTTPSLRLGSPPPPALAHIFLRTATSRARLGRRVRRKPVVADVRVDLFASCPYRRPVRAPFPFSSTAAAVRHSLHRHATRYPAHVFLASGFADGAVYILFQGSELCRMTGTVSFLSHPLSLKFKLHSYSLCGSATAYDAVTPPLTDHSRTASAMAYAWTPATTAAEQIGT